MDKHTPAKLSIFLSQVQIKYFTGMPHNPHRQPLLNMCVGLLKPSYWETKNRKCLQLDFSILHFIFSNFLYLPHGKPYTANKTLLGRLRSSKLTKLLIWVKIDKDWVSGNLNIRGRGYAYISLRTVSKRWVPLWLVRICQPWIHESKVVFYFWKQIYFFFIIFPYLYIKIWNYDYPQKLHISKK